MKSQNPNSGIYKADTTRTLDNNGGNPACNQGGMIVLEPREEYCTASKASFFCKSHCDGKAETLVATDYKDPQIVCYGLDRASFNQGQNAKYDFSVENDLAQTIVAKGPGGGTEQKTVGALCASDYKGVGNQYVNDGKLIIQNIGEPSSRQQDQDL